MQVSAPSTPPPMPMSAPEDIESGVGSLGASARTSAKKQPAATSDAVALSGAGDEKGKDELDGVSPWVLALWNWLRCAHLQHYYCEHISEIFLRYPFSVVY